MCAAVGVLVLSVLCVYICASFLVCVCCPKGRAGGVLSCFVFGCLVVVVCVSCLLLCACVCVVVRCCLVGFVCGLLQYVLFELCPIVDRVRFIVVVMCCFSLMSVVGVLCCGVVFCVFVL